MWSLSKILSSDQLCIFARHRQNRRETIELFRPAYSPREPYNSPGPVPGQTRWRSGGPRPISIGAVRDGDPGRTMRILIVDDDAAHAEALAEALTARGNDAYFASSGAEAEWLAGLFRFDLAFIDFDLGETTGLD